MFTYIIIAYFIVGLIFAMVACPINNIVKEYTEDGIVKMDALAWIGVVIGYLIVTICWPYYAYIAIKAALSND